MIKIVSSNIISGLGFTSDENYGNVKLGITGLRFYADSYGLPEPLMASKIDEARLDEAFSALMPARSGDDRLPAKYTKFEKAAIVSISEALKSTAVDPADPRVIIIISTTKGNVFLLDENEREDYEDEQLYLWRSAEIIAYFFGNPNQPLVVSNACISGASALIAASRELSAGHCDYAIVTGADMLSKFAIAGFQSFKALSPELCKPFDANRRGLNLGEAAATMILAEHHICDIDFEDIMLTNSAMHNDANHISAPSRTGEGSLLCLKKVMGSYKPGQIAFVNAHGTATSYNDEMESVALSRAGLRKAPVNSLKGYFGHTLGAAGILESIISISALKEGIVLGTHGFDTLGVTKRIRIVKENEPTGKRHFIKMLSGFGGTNAALLFTQLKTPEFHDTH